MRKFLIFSVVMLFGVSVFAAADYQKYGECVKKSESKLNELKSFCDTEAKARLNMGKCQEITKISLKCQCDNLGTEEACKALKTLSTTPATKAPAKKDSTTTTQKPTAKVKK